MTRAICLFHQFVSGRLKISIWHFIPLSIIIFVFIFSMKHFSSKEKDFGTWETKKNKRQNGGIS